MHSVDFAMSRTKKAGKEGYVLAVVMVVMVIFMMTCASFLNFTYVDVAEVSKKSNEMETFWAGESANNYTIRLLEITPSYRASPTNMVGTLSLNTYTTLVQKSFSEYTLTTTASHGSWKKTIAQRIRTTPIDWHPAFTNYAAYAHTGAVTSAPSATITGSTRSYGSGGSIGLPGIEAAYFDVFTDQATASGSLPVASNIDLNGADLFIKGDQDISNLVGGPARLIVSGNVTLTDGASVATNLTIISGSSVQINPGTTIDTDTFVYANGNITISSNTTFSAYAKLVAGSSLDLGSYSSVQGILFAGNNMTISSNAIVSGSMVAGNQISIGDNCTISHQPGYFSPTIPDGIEGSAEHRSASLEWSLN